VSLKLARHDAQVRRFMTVPGVGPITALAFKATIDDPARFVRSRSVSSPVDAMRPERSIGQVASRSAATPCCEVIYLNPAGFCWPASQHGPP
jgi:transposase